MLISKLRRSSPDKNLIAFPQRRSLLLVEDEPSLRRQVNTHLTNVGFDVMAVADGDAALLALRECRPDLLFLDLNLPRISGYEVCEQIRIDPNLQDLPVLMTSERVTLGARAHSYEAGADAYLEKPYTLEQLTREVHRLLDTSATSYAGYR